jgi:hypothetical protein
VHDGGGCQTWLAGPGSCITHPGCRPTAVLNDGMRQPATSAPIHSFPHSSTNTTTRHHAPLPCGAQAQADFHPPTDPPRNSSSYLTLTLTLTHRPTQELQQLYPAFYAVCVGPWVHLQPSGCVRGGSHAEGVTRMGSVAPHWPCTGSDADHQTDVCQHKSKDRTATPSSATIDS